MPLRGLSNFPYFQTKLPTYVQVRLTWKTQQREQVPPVSPLGALFARGPWDAQRLYPPFPAGTWHRTPEADHRADTPMGPREQGNHHTPARSPAFHPHTHPPPYTPSSPSPSATIPKVSGCFLIFNRYFNFLLFTILNTYINRKKWYNHPDSRITYSQPI